MGVIMNTCLEAVDLHLLAQTLVSGSVLDDELQVVLRVGSLGHERCQGSDDWFQMPWLTKL